jgi:hypothetical protein
MGTSEEVEQLLQLPVFPDCALMCYVRRAAPVGYLGVFTSKEFTTPLMCAALRGSPHIVALLCEAGANLDKESTYPFRGTALCAAATSGHMSVACQLVKLGADKDKLSNRISTALYCAANAGHHDIVQFLCDAGADKNIPTRYDHQDTPLAKAARLGDAQMVRLLCNAGADMNYAVGDVPLIVALKNHHDHVVHVLHDCGAERLSFCQLCSLCKPESTCALLIGVVTCVFILFLPYLGAASASIAKAVGAVTLMGCSFAGLFAPAYEDYGDLPACQAALFLLIFVFLAVWGNLQALSAYHDASLCCGPWHSAVSTCSLQAWAAKMLAGGSLMVFPVLILITIYRTDGMRCDDDVSGIIVARGLASIFAGQLSVIAGAVLFYTVAQDTLRVISCLLGLAMLVLLIYSIRHTLCFAQSLCPYRCWSRQREPDRLIKDASYQVLP